MGLSAEFKQAIRHYSVTCAHDNLLTFKDKTEDGNLLTSFDFLKRCMIVTFYDAIKETQSFSHTGNGNGYAAMTSNISVTPFSQLDRDMLENIRNYMIEIFKKTPLPLPEIQDAGFGFNMNKKFG